MHLSRAIQCAYSNEGHMKAALARTRYGTQEIFRDVPALNIDPGVGRYVVEVENFESIHDHSALARIAFEAAP